MKSILSIIPRHFRMRGVVVSFTILLRAVLNFVSLAAMLPILYLILDSDAVHSNKYLLSIYNFFGFDSEVTFAVAISLALVVVVVVKCAVNIGLYRFERDFIYELYRYLSRNLYIDYFERGLQFIKSSNSAVLARNVNVVCYSFVAGVLRPIASIFSEVMLIGMIFLAISIYSPFASLLTLAIFIPTAWMYFALIRERANRYGSLENEAQRIKYRNVVETYRGYADIEINNAFPRMLGVFDSTIDTIIRVGAKNATMSMLPHSFTEIGLALGMSMLVCLSVGFDSGNMKILFGIFAVAALRLLPSVRSIMAAWTSLRYNAYAVEIISSADINANREQKDPSADRMNLGTSIRVDNISFRFEDAQDDVLHNLSFEIRRGERIGIQGRSGAGKTTLMNLLLGLYSPTDGHIYIDDSLLTDENRRMWQNAIGYVSQNVYLTDDTILANIALGCQAEQIDIARVEEVVKMASLDEFIASLPKGLNTRIGECGALLSGGQRQRIGIARALYKRADVLFFDEATSALDTQTEESINASIEALSAVNKELTLVIIAHRDTSLRGCDRIITI